VIAADSSSFIAHLSGADGEDVEILDQAMADHLVVLPPVVLVELLSDPKLPSSVSGLLKLLPLLRTEEGYWERAGELRAKALSKRRKARLADVLIAQSCLDYDIPLIARDRDFRTFSEFAGLKLLPPYEFARS
jgi:predicted nucleic acid-binding protein